MASSLPAQVLYGSLTGNVTDSTDAAIPNAKVTAVNANTGIERQVVTDERGAYVFSLMTCRLASTTSPFPRRRLAACKPEAILKKVYWNNAARLLKLPPL